MGQVLDALQCVLGLFFYAVFIVAFYFIFQENDQQP